MPHSAPPLSQPVPETPAGASRGLSTRFVLISPSHAGNVGAVARAMKTMAFDELVLVSPRWPDVLARSEAQERASGASDVLTAARVVDHLDDALQGITHLCATAMVPRDFGPPTRSPRAHFTHLAANGWPLPGLRHAQSRTESTSDAAPRQSIAFLFGEERFGMRNADVYRCHVALTIPTNPAYGSLNLASAVQVIAYEWRLALGGFAATAPASTAAPPADAVALAGLLEHWERTLIDIAFLDPTRPKKLMPRLRQLLNRAQLSDEEVHILRGIAKATQRAAEGRIKRPLAAPDGASD